jgi:hypothetical protein
MLHPNLMNPEFGSTTLQAYLDRKEVRRKAENVGRTESSVSDPDPDEKISFFFLPFNSKPLQLCSYFAF